MTATTAPAGLLTYGIPGFKLEKPVVMQRIEQLEAGGVQFVLNCNVGVDISFDAIRGQHDAVLIATGVYKARDLAAPGVGAAGIVRGAGLSDRVEPQELRRRGRRRSTAAN